MTKPALDVVPATFGLSVLSPVLVAIAAWVRFDSGGPAVVRQERVGEMSLVGPRPAIPRNGPDGSGPP